jgi:hypothetical protein
MMGNRLRDTHQYANLRRRRQVTSPPRTTASGLLIGGEWVERAVAAAASTAGAPPLPAWRRAEILEGRLAFTPRVPVGVGCAIAPLNAPLNTVAHPRIVVLNLTAPGRGG